MSILKKIISVIIFIAFIIFGYWVDTPVRYLCACHDYKRKGKEFYKNPDMREALMNNNKCRILKGRWVKYSEEACFCPFCGTFYAINEVTDVKYDNTPKCWNFCPHCGSVMEREMVDADKYYKERDEIRGNYSKKLTPRKYRNNKNA